MNEDKESVRILILSPFNPFPPYWGGASRIYNLTKYLTNVADIILIYNDISQIMDTKDGPKYIEELENLGVHIEKVSINLRLSQIINPLLLIKALKIARDKKPNFILSEFIWLGGTAWLISALSGIPFGVDEHNVEYLRFERMKRGSTLFRRILKWYESKVIMACNKVFCVSEFDKSFLISELNLDKNAIKVIRNGVDSSLYDNLRLPSVVRDEIGLPQNVPVFLFHGKLDYLPNQEALQVIHEEIIPKLRKKCPEAQIVIAGDNPPEYLNGEDGILTLGIYPNLAELINASDCIISPLISGGGTRIKIIEALFSGKPVVSTSIGAEGLEVDEFQGWIRIAEDWDQFLECMLDVTSNRFNIDRALPSKLLKRHDWKFLSMELANEIMDLKE